MRPLGPDELRPGAQLSVEGESPELTNVAKLPATAVTTKTAHSSSPDRGHHPVRGQPTAARWNTRRDAVAARVAQAASTSRLSSASVVVLANPQMSCSPSPLRSSTP